MYDLHLGSSYFKDNKDWKALHTNMFDDQHLRVDNAKIVLYSKIDSYNPRN